MLTAYVFGPAWNVIDPSMPCGKLLAYLALAGVEHDTRTGFKYLRQAPKGKMPYVRDGDQLIGDSNLIMEHLQTSRGIDTDAHLSDDQRAAAHALGRMLDEHTYWTVAYFRWMVEANFNAHTLPTLFAKMPAWQQWLVPRVARKGLRDSLNKHGLGRHSEQEIGALGVADYRCLARTLGDRDFLFGDQPAAIDATAYAYVTAITGTPIESPMREFVADSPLPAYAERFAQHVGLTPQAPASD